MTIRRYRSSIPDVTIPDESLFTFLFEGKIDEEIPGTIHVFVDAPTRRSFTRSEFKAACLSLGWGLRNVFANELGGMKITRGDTVMILSPNSFAWPLALFGSISGGFKITFTDPLSTREELARKWKDSGAKVVFTNRALVPVVFGMLEKNGVSEEEARKRIVVMGVGDRDATADGLIHMDDLRGKGSRAVAERFDGPLSNETVYLCYSSGTTGKPKGVEVSLSYYRVIWYGVLTSAAVDTQEYHRGLPHAPTGIPSYPDRKGCVAWDSTVLPYHWYAFRRFFFLEKRD